MINDELGGGYGCGDDNYVNVDDNIIIEYINVMIIVIWEDSSEWGINYGIDSVEGEDSWDKWVGVIDGEDGLVGFYGDNWGYEGVIVIVGIGVVEGNEDGYCNRELC